MSQRNDRPSTTLTSISRKKGSSPLVRFGKRIRRRVDTVLASQSRIENTPVLNPADFDFVAPLREKADIIREEALACIMGGTGVHVLADVSPDHRRIAGDRKWTSLFLVGYGYEFAHNCERCPETTRILRQIPGLNSGFFSIMKAGAVIPPHRGVTKALLTCHLGLSIPTPRENCGIKVDEQTLHWGEGDVMVFDDTYRHEAWNRTDEDRIILLIQFKRPMSPAGRFVGDTFLRGIRMSTFVQDARENLVARDKAQGLDASSRRLH